MTRIEPLFFPLAPFFSPSRLDTRGGGDGGTPVEDHAGVLGCSNDANALPHIDARFLMTGGAEVTSPSDRYEPNITRLDIDVSALARRNARLHH